MSEWKTIDSAPKDGTAVLVYEGDTSKKMWRCSWWPDMDSWTFGVTSNDHTLLCLATNIQPTHWQPLPAPPK